MMREASESEVFHLLAQPLRFYDYLDLGDMNGIEGALTDEREIGDEDIDAEDAERREGRLAFVRKEEATA